jgi:hypothetical protein
MAITLNKVGVEIDGKVYEFYKLSFGFQRKLVEVQSNLNKLTNETAKKYGVDVSEVNNSDKVPEEAKLEIAKAGLELQEALATLFVNPEEAKILDNFDGDSLTQLIEALK